MNDGEVRVCDVYGVPPGVLRDRSLLTSLLRDACDEAGLTILKEMYHDFESGGEGFTTILLLVESHLALHTWPEDNYFALTIDTCWNGDLTSRVLDYIFGEVTHESISIETVDRHRKR